MQFSQHWWICDARLGDADDVVAVDLGRVAHGAVAALGTWSVTFHPSKAEEVVDRPHDTISLLVEEEPSGYYFEPARNRFIVELHNTPDPKTAEIRFPFQYFDNNLGDLLDKLGLCDGKEGGIGPSISVPSGPFRHLNACTMAMLPLAPMPGSQFLECLQSSTESFLKPKLSTVAVRIPDGCEVGEPTTIGIIIGFILGTATSVLGAWIYDALTQDADERRLRELEARLMQLEMQREIEEEDSKLPKTEPLPEEEAEEPEETEEPEEPTEQEELEGPPPPPTSYPIDGSCGGEAARRAGLFFECAFGGEPIAPGFGVGPFVMPGPDFSTGLSECNSVKTDWSSPNGPGVVDPPGPEYWVRGSPMKVDWTAMPDYGVVDPPRTHDLWWLWSQRDRFNLLPGDAHYKDRRHLEDQLESHIANSVVGLGVRSGDQPQLGDGAA